MKIIWDCPPISQAQQLHMQLTHRGHSQCLPSPGHDAFWEGNSQPGRRRERGWALYQRSLGVNYFNHLPTDTTSTPAPPSLPLSWPNFPESQSPRERKLVSTPWLVMSGVNEVICKAPRREPSADDWRNPHPCLPQLRVRPEVCPGGPKPGWGHGQRTDGCLGHMDWRSHGGSLCPIFLVFILVILSGSMIFFKMKLQCPQDWCCL